MAKKVLALIKLQLAGGSATPAPPVGPALGQQGLNIMEFVKAFNEKTKKDVGTVIPVVITVYADRTFSFITKTPPAVELLKKAAGVTKGSAESNIVKVGKVSWAQIKEIAEIKLPDLNTWKIESACSMIAGTARSMGLEVTGRPDAGVK